MVFQKIVREWCRTYKPMLDSVTNGNRRFYVTENWDGVRTMPKSISPKLSPCVIMESVVEVNIDGGLVNRNYPIYFIVRARDKADSDAAAEAREEAWYHCLNFLAWLKQRHEEDSPQGDYGRINMEETMVADNIGPLEDGWHGVGLQIERCESMNLCVDPDLYIDDYEDE